MNRFNIIQRDRRARRDVRQKKKMTKNVNFFDFTDVMFKSHFRFSKESVRLIADTLRADLTLDSRGSGLSAEDQVCVALLQLGGATFQRICGLACGISRDCARLAVKRVVKALVKRIDNFIKFPSEEEMSDTAYRMYQRYGLTDFACGVDGVLMRFQKMPRSEVAFNPQDYNCRKGF